MLEKGRAGPAESQHSLSANGVSDPRAWKKLTSK
jgi:hypothetical protein